MWNIQNGCLSEVKDAAEGRWGEAVSSCLPKNEKKAKVPTECVGKGPQYNPNIT